MAKHGQRRESEQQGRQDREQGGEGERQSGGQQGWSGGQHESSGRESGQRESGGHGWAEDSGFGEGGRYGSGHGQREPTEDFSRRQGGPSGWRRQESWRDRGQSSGSGWGPEQDLGPGSYRGNRRSWEGEERGAYMDRQRDYRQGEFGGDPYYGQGGGEGYASGFAEHGGQYGQGGMGHGEPGGGQRFGQGREGLGGRQGGFGGEMGRGRFSGRGPKGYRRSDDRIKEDVSEQLTQHPDIDPSEIEIKVQSGEVTLTGTVDSRQAKRMVEDLVEAASGVKEVNNQLRVKQRHETGTGSDGAGTADTQGSKSRT